MGKGDGTFKTAVWVSSGPLVNSYLGMDVGDLTGNGKLDFVGADWTPNAADIVVFPGNGDGTFQTPTGQSDAGAGFVALADFNGDGKLDVLIGYAATAQVALGNGNGTFQLNSQLPIYAANTGNGIIVRSADLDRDGKPDALVADYSGGVFTVVLNDASPPCFHPERRGRCEALALAKLLS